MNRNKLTVIGLGLMAGSFAMACKQQNCFNSVQGYDIDEAVTNYALDNYIIDQKIAEINTANLQDSDVIVLGTPLTATLNLLPKLAEVINHEALIFDLGSVKESIVSAGGELFSSHRSTFIGAHPMVGSHEQGISNATPDLYNNKPFILVPTTDSNTETSKDDHLKKLYQLIEEITARPVIMSSQDHDHMAAGLSHLPHLLAIAMMQATANSDHDNVDLSLAGGSFKDMTRVAQSDPQLWHDIFSHNCEEMAKWWSQIKTQIEKNLEYYQNISSSNCSHNTQGSDQLSYLEQAATARKSLE